MYSFIQKLAKHESTGQYSAVKILNMEHIVQHKHLSHVINERKILSSINFEFLIRLLFTMKDNSYVYLGMEFINGGEMFTVLRR
jgi:serine/threonine protein kinase